MDIIKGITFIKYYFSLKIYWSVHNTRESVESSHAFWVVPPYGGKCPSTMSLDSPPRPVPLGRCVSVWVGWFFFCWPFFSFLFSLIFSLLSWKHRMVDICYWFFRFSLCFFCIFILEPLLKFIYFQFNSSILICYLSHFSIWSFFFWFLFFFLGPFVKVLMVFNFIIQSMFMVFYFSNLILILFIFLLIFFFSIQTLIKIYSCPLIYFLFQFSTSLF